MKYGSDQADLNMHEFLDNFEKSREKKKNKLKELKEKKIGFDEIFEQVDLSILPEEILNEEDEETQQ